MSCLLAFSAGNDLNQVSERRSPPRLIITSDNNSITDAIVAADGVRVSILSSSKLASETTLCTILANLLAVYYAWDLCYPRQYQILLFPQLYLLKDDKDKAGLFKSATYLTFEKMFLAQIQG